MNVLMLPAAVFVAAAGILPARLEPVQANRMNEVRRGMTAAEVKAILGPPSRICRQIFFRRHIEQWHYDDSAGWVEFSAVRGEEAMVIQKGRLTTSP
jgi:hypothetical protein